MDPVQLEGETINTLCPFFLSKLRTTYKTSNLSEFVCVCVCVCVSWGDPNKVNVSGWKIIENSVIHPLQRDKEEYH